jgi:hypothetical protein
VALKLSLENMNNPAARRGALMMDLSPEMSDIDERGPTRQNDLARAHQSKRRSGKTITSTEHVRIPLDRSSPGLQMNLDKEDGRPRRRRKRVLFDNYLVPASSLVGKKDKASKSSCTV